MTGKIDPETWENLPPPPAEARPSSSTRSPHEDADGPFTPDIPEDMEEKAKLDKLGYTILLELLAEKFHSSPEFLKKLNPEASFAAGETIRVPNVRAKAPKQRRPATSASSSPRRTAP